MAKNWLPIDNVIRYEIAETSRIERFAWQEPNHLMAPSIFYMKDGKTLWEKFLKDLRLAQHSAEDRFRDLQGNLFCPGEGLVPSQAPCYIPNVLPVPGMGSFYDIIPWGSTCILGTRWHWLFYGDLSVVKDNYDTGRRYLEYLKTKINEEGFLNHGLGDWGNPENRLARENVETAFLYADAITLAEFARLLEKPEPRRSGKTTTKNSSTLMKSWESGVIISGGRKRKSHRRRKPCRSSGEWCRKRRKQTW